MDGSLVCGTAITKTLSAYRTADGDRFGANVAENELLWSTLSEFSNMEWDFWWHGLTPTLTSIGNPPPEYADVDELKKRFPGRVHRRSLLTLPLRLAQAERYVFVTSIPNLPKISEIRRHLAGTSLPLCGLLHSACIHNLVGSYLWLLTSLSEADVLVTSSVAGARALRALLALAGERLCERLPGHSIDPLSLIKARAESIPFGISVPTSSGEGLTCEQARTILGLEPDAFVVLYLGRLSQEYKADLDVLIRAVERIPQSVGTIDLICAGQDLNASYGTYLRRRVRNRNGNGKGIVLDNVQDCFKTIVLRAASVFVSPVDSVQETFGLALLEAMAHKLPVIAPSWSGYREIVVDGITGILIETRWSAKSAEIASIVASAMSAQEVAHFLAQRTTIDVDHLTTAIETLAVDRERGRKMGEAGYKRVVECYTSSGISRRFVDLWHAQAEHARSIAPLGGEVLDLNSVFGHYASDHIPDSCMLIMSETSDYRMGDSVLNNWEFARSTMRDAVRDLFNRCREQPVELAPHASPLEREAAVWLTKKGICRIV